MTDATAKRPEAEIVTRFFQCPEAAARTYGARLTAAMLDGGYDPLTVLDLLLIHMTPARTADEAAAVATGAALRSAAAHFEQLPGVLAELAEIHAWADRAVADGVVAHADGIRPLVGGQCVLDRIDRARELLAAAVGGGPRRGKTRRGFPLISFTDHYGVACTLQQSSLATEDAVWFGPTEPLDGQPYSRAHLTREMVAALIPALEHFVRTGVLPEGVAAPGGAGE